jgi:hypothetical protein
VADTALAVGETSLVTFTFSEVVTGFTNADLAVANGTLGAVSSNDGGVTWTATFTPTAEVTDTSNLITLANTGVADAAGNAGSGSTDSANYAIDTARPTATIVVADSALAVGETAQVTVTFSEPVTGFSLADLSVTNGTLSGLSSSDGGTTWTATFTPDVGIEQGGVQITLANAGVLDGAGNAGSGSTASATLAIDTRVPVVSAITDAGLQGDTVVYTLRFSEAVSGLDVADFVLQKGSSVQATVEQVTAVDDLTYTVQVGGVGGSGPLTLLFQATGSGVTDAAGNAVTQSASSAEIAVRPPAIPAEVVPPPAAAPVVVVPQSTVVLPLVVVSADPISTAGLPVIVAATQPSAPTGLGLLGGAAYTTANGQVGSFSPGVNVGLTPTPLSPADSGRTGPSAVPGFSSSLTAMPDVGSFNAVAGSAVDIRLPPSTFSHADPTARVVVEARQSNGQPLPAWLRFDPVTGALSGQPPAGMQMQLSITLTARDEAGRQATTQLNLRIEGRQTERPAGATSPPTPPALPRPGAMLWPPDAGPHREALAQADGDVLPTPAAAEQATERTAATAAERAGHANADPAEARRAERTALLAQLRAAAQRAA